MKISTANTYSAGLQAAGPSRRVGVDEARQRSAGASPKPETPVGPKPIQMSGAGRFDLLVYTGVPMKFEVVGNVAAAVVEDELSRDKAQDAPRPAPAKAAETSTTDKPDTQAPMQAASKHDPRPTRGRSVDIEV